jgi:hypothetical protein
MRYLQDRIYSIDATPKKLRTDQQTLDRVYEGAKLGLKMASMAYHAELTESELRQLEQLDPRVSEAISAGRADQEMELSRLMMDAARNGDSKSALEILKCKHGWISASVVKNELSGPDGGPVQLSAVDFRSLSNDEIETMQKLLEKTVQD